MKLIVSSDRESVINAECIGHFFILPVGDTGEYTIHADGAILAKCNGKDNAVRLLKELCAELSIGGTLHEMEDTI